MMPRLPRARALLLGICLLVPALAAGFAPAAMAQDVRTQVQLATTENKAARSAAPRGAEILARAWPLYKKRFISPEGRVIDNGNGGISHSEGQGYGMLLAVATQDREAFDLLWKWTSTNLSVRGDGLSAWRWEPGRTPNVTDKNNASDGDILIAWALGEAGIRWNEPQFTQTMLRISKAIFEKNVITTRVGPTLLPGAVGFSASDRPDGPVVNLSYWIFPAIDRLQQMDTANNWAGLRRSGLTLLREGRYGPLGLPPEWLSVGEKQASPAAKFERTFGYNAVRIPLYLAWSPRVPNDHLKPFLTMWNPGANLGPFIIDIDDGKAGALLDAPGYRMVFALAQCIAHQRPAPRDLAAATNELYYPATLGLLSVLAISERRPQCL